MKNTVAIPPASLAVLAMVGCASPVAKELVSAPAEGIFSYPSCEAFIADYRQIFAKDAKAVADAELRLKADPSEANETELVAAQADEAADHADYFALAREHNCSVAP